MEMSLKISSLQVPIFNLFTFIANFNFHWFSWGFAHKFAISPTLWRFHKASGEENGRLVAYKENKRMIDLEGLLIHVQTHGHYLQICMKVKSKRILWPNQDLPIITYRLLRLLRSLPHWHRYSRDAWPPKSCVPSSLWRVHSGWLCPRTAPTCPTVMCRG